MAKLREIDKSIIYISHLIGYNKNNRPIYSEPIATKGQILQNKSGRTIQDYNGIVEQFDLKVLFEYNNINKYINELTKFWIDTTPNGDNGNYKTIKKGRWEEGILKVYLTSLQQNWNSVYTFSKDYGIFEIQCYLDEENLLLKIPKDSYFNTNLSVETKIWLRQPINEEDTSNLYYINDIDKEENFICYSLESVAND